MELLICFHASKFSAVLMVDVVISNLNSVHLKMDTIQSICRFKDLLCGKNIL